MKVRRGFTLIELLVVIAIIALLVSILLPSLNRAKHLAREVTCASNMRSLGIAAHIYGAGNDGYTPPIGRWLRSTSTISAMMYYSYNNPDDSADGKISNLGILGEQGYVDLHSPIYFCSLNQNEQFQDSGGEAGHINLASNADAGQIAQFGYINKRCGYLRHHMETETETRGAQLWEIANRAWLADVFSASVVVDYSHGDNVNVLRGDNSVRKQPYPTDEDPYSLTGYDVAGQAYIEEVWEILDDG